MEHLDLEMKFSADGTGLIEGYASMFGGDPDSHGDIVAPGAFANTLKAHEAAGTAPLLLWQHDTTDPVGVWVDLVEDAKGLRVSGRLILDSTRGRDAYALLKNGALNGLSIGYRVRKSERRPGGGRILQNLDLVEISLVSIPSASAARITSIKAAQADNPAAQGAANNGGHDMAEDEKAAAPEAEKKVGMEIEERVTGLEDNMTEIDTRLKSVEETVGSVKAAAGRIEMKLGRPGIITKTEEPADMEKKAFSTYARAGEAAAGVEIKNLTSANNGGGYLAPTEFVKEVVKGLVEFSPVRNYARVMNISAAEAKMPKRTGTLTSAWVSETGNRATTDPTYDEVTLTPHEAACFVDVSNALLEDNAYNLEAELAADFAEEFGRLEGDAFVNGDGTGKPAGILQDTSITSVPSGAASTFDSDALIDLFHALPSFYAANGVWGMNRSTIGMVRKMKDTNGRYLWVDPVSEGNPPTILGRPVVELPDMPDVAAAALPVMFGDLRQGYRIVDRIALSVMRDPFTQAAKGQTRFHARRRVGGAVVKSEALRLLKIGTS